LLYLFISGYFVMVGAASSGDPLVYGIVQQFCGTQRATFLWQLVRGAGNIT